MKKHRIVTFSTFFFIAATEAQALPMLSIVPSAQSINLGNPLSVALKVSGLDSATALSAFDIDLNFDQAHLTFQSGSLGDPVLGDQLDLLGLGNLSSITAGAGTVNLLEVSFDDSALLDAQQADSFTLAQLSFASIQPGNITLQLSINTMGDSLGNPLTVSVSPISVLINGTSVPEPTSLPLLMMGLGVVTMFRRTQW